jgi:hypothetical protein
VVKHRRFDLLDDEPTEDEVNYFDGRAAKAASGRGGKP